ncbi:MAG: GreA/GreB family elongation factor [Oligoflexia bacterium]|nr:GreA/GreB family elongation factor [Oligoflexia bacterium]
MKNKKILQILIDRTEEELKKAKESFDSSRNFATDEEFKSESKWDTRSIEAGYLAGAQGMRVDELEKDLNLLQEVDLSLVNDKEVGIGSIVEFEFNGQTRTYFLAPVGGGTLIDLDGEAILVISIFSPIGHNAIGLGAGESFVVEIKGEEREYTIVSIQ